MYKRGNKMKIYNCTFKALTHTLIIRCLGKNKREALRCAKANFEKSAGGNPNWLKLNMITEVK